MEIEQIVFGQCGLVQHGVDEFDGQRVPMNFVVILQRLAGNRQALGKNKLCIAEGEAVALQRRRVMRP